MMRRNFSADTTRQNSQSSQNRWLGLMLTIALAVPALSLGSSRELAAQTSWTPEQMMKVRGVGGVRVSPDGRRVLFTVNEAVMTPEKSEYLTQIWSANADGGDA